MKWFLRDPAHDEPRVAAAVRLLQRIVEGTAECLQPPHWTAEVMAVPVCGAWPIGLRPSSASCRGSSCPRTTIPPCIRGRCTSHAIRGTTSSTHTATPWRWSTVRSLVTADRAYHRKARPPGAIELLDRAPSEGRTRHGVPGLRSGPELAVRQDHGHEEGERRRTEGEGDSERLAGALDPGVRAHPARDEGGTRPCRRCRLWPTGRSSAPPAGLRDIAQDPGQLQHDQPLPRQLRRRVRLRSSSPLRGMTLVSPKVVATSARQCARAHAELSSHGAVPPS